MASLVKALSNEWSSKGVNVNGIAPGYIATDNTEALRNDEERSKAILDRIPASRWGTRKILQVLQYFFHLQPVIMLTVQFLLLTADGWDVNFIPQSAIIKSEICIETLVTNTIFLMTIIKTNNHKNITTMQIRFESSPREVKGWTLRLYALGIPGGKPMTEDNISLTYSYLRQTYYRRKPSL